VDYNETMAVVDLIKPRHKPDPNQKMITHACPYNHIVVVVVVVASNDECRMEAFW